MGNAGGKPYTDSPNSTHISRRELERLQRRFSRLSHGTDRVSIRQLAAEPDLSNPFVQRLFELHDADGDGYVLHEEFLNAMYAIRKLASSPQDRLKCEMAGRSHDIDGWDHIPIAFQLYDLDGDGFVSISELTKMAEHDADGDGKLCFDEFHSLVVGSLGQQGLPVSIMAS